MAVKETGNPCSHGVVYMELIFQQGWQSGKQQTSEKLRSVLEGAECYGEKTAGLEHQHRGRGNRGALETEGEASRELGWGHGSRRPAWLRGGALVFEPWTLPSPIPFLPLGIQNRGVWE